MSRAVLTVHPDGTWNLDHPAATPSPDVEREQHRLAYVVYLFLAAPALAHRPWWQRLAVRFSHVDRTNYPAGRFWCSLDDDGNLAIGGRVPEDGRDPYRAVEP